MFGMGNKRQTAAPAPVPKERPSSARRAAPVSVTVRLSPAQRDKLQRLGGEAWLREQIDAADEPPG